MLKLSKNIEVPDGLYPWLERNRNKLINEIENKYIDAESGYLNQIEISDKIKLIRPYNNEEIEIQVIIVPKETFAERGWSIRYDGYAESIPKVIWLNADNLHRKIRSSEWDRYIKYLMTHEVTHILDPKLYKKEVPSTEHLPYYNRPHEFDAHSAQLSRVIRDKYSPERILEMLRSNVLEIHPKRHKALDAWTLDQLRKFKIRLYQDIMRDLEETKEEQIIFKEE